MNEDITVDKPGPNEVLIQTMHTGCAIAGERPSEYLESAGYFADGPTAPDAVRASISSGL